MNQAINFETLAFELDPEYQAEEFELENERGRRPLGRSSGQRQQPASQRNSRSTGYRSSAKKPRPRPRAPQKPWEIIRQPYGLVSNTYPAQNSFDSERVRWIQDSLNRTLGLQLPVDGIMGAEVRSAIRSFQKQENLPVNGIVGPDTEQALMKASTSIPPSKQEEFEFFDTRLTDTEWEGEVNRSSPDYIRWVQTSLNKILAFRLAVDGISGTATRSAVRSFQQKKGLTADGIVGPITEAALISAGAGRPPATGIIITPGTGAYPNVNTQLPDSGPGFYGKPENRYHQYGQADTIRAIQAIGAAWQKRYPQGPRIGITDISLRGGGDTPNHSGHENGLEVDFRLFRNDGLETGSNIRDSSYSRSLTQELVNTILANGILKVDKILFNDSGVTPVRPSSGHDDHLHVYFLAGTNQPVHNPGSTTITKPITGTLRDKIGLIAKEEYVRWGNGSTKESDPRIQSVLRDYWITGVGSEEGYQQKYYWSAAFISWVIKKAGAGNAFQYSAMHGTYIKAAKDNRYSNNSNPFKAYRTTEVKPRIGDLVCTYYDGSWNYDNIQASPGMHCDIVTEVAAGKLTTIGGNVSDSVSKKTVTLDTNGYINQQKYFAVIRVEA